MKKRNSNFLAASSSLGDKETTTTHPADSSRTLNSHLCNKKRRFNIKIPPQSPHQKTTPLPHHHQSQFGEKYVPPKTQMALASRCCARIARSSSPSLRLSQPIAYALARRWNTTTATADPKISGIVDQISGLTLMETADLVSLLKVSLFFPHFYPPQHRY